MTLTSPPSADRRIAGYAVLEELGRGATSTVYRVRRQGGAEYALKIIDARPACDVPDLASSRREAALLASVDDPGLPRIHEVGAHEGRPYLVLDIVDGSALTDLLKAGALAPEQVVALATDLLGPLTAIHRRGLVHRDLKPDNVVVTPLGQARLIDFGLAARETADTVSASVGTLAYSPPEQTGVLRRPVDQRSDLYSLGVVLFECLTGSLPFAAADVGELLRMHAVTQAPDLRSVASVGPGLAQVVATLLAKDPDDRYANGEELTVDLRRLADDPSASLATRRTDVVDRTFVTPLSGRTQELSRLLEEWESARAGSGRFCVLRGAAGGGKSRLAAELVRLVDARAGTVLWGRCEAGEPMPLAPLRSAVEQHLRAVERLPEQQRDVAHDRIREAAGHDAGLVATLTPALAAVLGPGLRTVRQDQFTIAFARFVGALARSGDGLLLVVGDVQWADPGTSLVLSQLSRVSGTSGLMVLLTTRDDPASTAATRDIIDSDPALELDLPALDEAGIAGLVRAALPGADADGSLVRLLYGTSGGNPLVAHEYLRAIVDAGVLSPSWGSWLLDERALDALELPRDLLHLVLKRVEGLGPSVRGLLVAAAVIGAQFHPDLLAAVHGAPLAEVQDRLVEAAGAGLLDARPNGAYAFLPERVREVLVAEVDDVERTRLHRRVAEVLQASLAPAGEDGAAHAFAIARHYLAAVDRQPGHRRVEQQEFAACWTAGRLAMSRHAPGEAVAFLRHAHRADLATDSAFLLTFGTALQQNSEYDEARARLEQALALERVPAVRGEVLVQLADVHRSSFRMDLSLSAVRQGLAELRASVPGNPLRAWLSTALMCLVVMTGWRRRVPSPAQLRRWEVVARLHEAASYVAAVTFRRGDVALHILRGLYWASRVGTGRQYARSRASFGFLCGLAGLQRIAARVFARLSVDPDGSEPRIQALVAHYHAASMYLGNLDDVEAWTAGVRRNGLLLDLSMYCDAVSNVITEAVFHGRTAEAQRWLELARLRQAVRAEDTNALIFAEPMVAALIGRPTDAAPALRRAEAKLNEHTPVVITVLRRLTELIMLCEQDETGPPFDRTVDSFERLGLRPTEMLRGQQQVHFYIAMGRLGQCRRAPDGELTGRLEAARASVRRVRAVAKRPILRAHHLVLRADLLVLESRPSAALALLARIPTLVDADSPVVAFETCRVRARALTALGATEEARRHVILARAIAVDSGWPHRADWVAAEFDPTGRSTGASDSTSAGRTWFSGSSQGTGSVVGALSRPTAGLEHQRLRALEQVSAAAARVLDPGTLARISLDETIRVLRAERAFLFLVDAAGGLVPHLGRGAEGQDLAELTAYSASLVDRVRHTGEPLVVTGTDEGAAMGAQSVVLHGLRSIMVAPLMLEGRLLGVVYLDSRVAKGIFSADDAGILVALTNHIATSLETARAAQLEISVHAARRERDLADTLRSAITAMSDTFEPAAVLTRLLHWAPLLMSCESAWILDTEGAGCTVTSLDDTGDHTGDHTVLHLDLDAGLSALLAADGPAGGDDSVLPPALRRLAPQSRTALVLPLRSRDRDLGVLVLAATEAAVALGERVQLASALVAQAMTAYDRATLFAKVQDLAVADELTGIPNRRRFFEVAERDLARALRSGQLLSVLMTDIDHFKRVNDTYGHPTGDDVITTVAQRLAATIRGTDFVGRYGGEEFAFILPETDVADFLPERLRACIADEPVATRSGPVDITISVGMATLAEDDADLTALLARADRALYQAKRDGRNRVRVD